MAGSDERMHDDELQQTIRRDSHLALGCGLTFALVTVSALIIYVLVGT